MKGINAMVPSAQNAALVWNTRGQPPTASTPLVTEDWKMAPMLPSPFCVVGIQPHTHKGTRIAMIILTNSTAGEETQARGLASEVD
jgi:hypothetical protein